MSLDALKSEIATKRKANGEGPRPSKYLRRGEVEKLKQEQERMEHEEKEQQRRKLENVHLGMIGVKESFFHGGAEGGLCYPGKWDMMYYSNTT